MFARKPANDWSTAERAVFPDTNGVADPPHQRVAGWASLFVDDFRLPPASR